MRFELTTNVEGEIDEQQYQDHHMRMRGTASNGPFRELLARAGCFGEFGFQRISYRSAIQAVRCIPHTEPLLVAAKKRYYAALLENPKTPREADMEALNQIVRPGDFALDIGAFVGFYSNGCRSW